MPVTREMLLTELQDLLRLTAFEQTIATVRRTQARTTPLATELAANAEKAAERLGLLKQAVSQVGGVPDVVGAGLGRAGAFLTSQLNQVQTLQEALLGDLTLEHRLRERTRYARTLAVSLGETSLLPVLDRLETAHSATIEWIEARLSEVGRTGSSALAATPVQIAAGTVRRYALYPFDAAAEGVNRASGLVARVLGKAPKPLQDLAGEVAVRAGQVAEAGIEKARTATVRGSDATAKATDRAEDAVSRTASGVGTVADKAQDAASTVGDKAQDAASTVGDKAQDAASTVGDKAQDAASTVGDKAQDAASTVGDKAQDAASTVGDKAQDAADKAEKAAEKTEDVLEASGGSDVDEVHPPFAGYEKLAGDSIIRHAQDTEDVEELRSLLAFEQAHKARKGVLAAAQERLTALSTSV